MPTLKNILMRQTAIPANLEASLPVLPKISGFLSQMAAAVPVDVQLPELPVGNGGAPPATQAITNVIKGIEDVLPAGVPKASGILANIGMGGFRPITTEESKKPTNHRIMGSGYRSIS